MRISDWSSDVCSSDLPYLGVRVAREQRRELAAHIGHRGERGHHQRHRRYRFVGDARIGDWGLGIGNSGYLVFAFPNPESRFPKDRKSVVSGKDVAVRVDLGGRRLIKKKKNTNT